MPKRNRRTDATASLVKLAKYFAEEVASRKWGDDEFDKLVRGSKSADARGREMTRHVLSALDRTTSIQVAADAVLQIVDGAEKPITARVVLAVLSALRDQAHLAVSNAFGAVRAVERPRLRYDARIRRLPFPKAAAALAAFQPEPSDLISLLAGHLTPVQRSLRESMLSCWFVERAIETVQGLVKKQRAIDAGAVRDLAMFLVKAASFARDVITVRVATAIECRPRPRGRSLAT